MHSSSLQLDTSYKTILKLTLPISLALIIPFLNVTVNNYFLGELGESELGTAGLTGVFFLIVAVIGNGLNNALQSLISRKAGENDPQQIGLLFGQGIKVALAFSIVAMTVTYLVVPVLFNALLHDEAVEQRAIEFIQARIWGLPFLYLFQSGNALLVGTTNTRYLPVGTLLQASCNILLDYLLIFGHIGFPQMGFQGAAWASVISEAVGMFIVFGVIKYKKLHLQFYLLNFLKTDWLKTRQILKTSAPLIGQYGISLVSWFLFFALIEHKGERALAISNIMRNVFMLCGIFTWAFAASANTMVSNVIGQKMEHEVMPLIHRIMRLSLLFAILPCLLLNLFSHQCLGLFGMPASFINEAEPVLRIVTAGILLMSVSTVALNAVTGTGNTGINLLAELVAIVCYFLYVYATIEWKYISLGLAWGSEILYWTIIFSIAYMYMRSGKWKQLLTGPQT